MKRAVVFTVENDERTVEDAIRAAMTGLMTRAAFTVDVIEACAECDSLDCASATCIEVSLELGGSHATH